MRRDFILMILLIMVILIYGCKREENISLATIITSDISYITSNSATSGGNISNTGGGNISRRGVCWSLLPNPTINDSKTVDGFSTGLFTSKLTNLLENTTYYVRSYAINSKGISYGNEVNFTTLPLSNIITKSVLNITDVSVDCGGVVTNDSGSTITSRGVVWSIYPNPTTSDNNTNDGSGIGSFVSKVTGLTAYTTYYIRSYAINSKGTYYGNEIRFVTPKRPYYIGEIGPGRGFVFYDKGSYDNGWRFLEAAYSDYKNEVSWGCTNVLIPNTSQDIGSGKKNSELIINSCGELNIAAKICQDLVSGGKDDWYLPSLKELILIYENLYRYGKGNFNFSTNLSYWSSSEYDVKGYNKEAYGFHFFFIGNTFGAEKSIKMNVRAIRSF